LKKVNLARACSAIIVLPIAFALVTFFVQNRHDVSLSLWPLSLQFSIPLSAIMLVILIVGVIWGGLAAWLTAGKNRRQGRKATRRADQTENDNRLLKSQIAQLEKTTQKIRAASKNDLTDPSLTLPPSNAA
jgi:uncharacterized integral membrane protein